jgi:hypothetical protein
MPVPIPYMENLNVKYEIPIQTKTYICNYCYKNVNSLRWIEKFSNEHFKCDDCWRKSGI